MSVNIDIDRLNEHDRMVAAETTDLYVSYLNRLCDSHTEPENLISQYINDTEAYYRAAVNRIITRKTVELNLTEPQGQES